MSKIYIKEIRDCTGCPHAEVYDEFDKNDKLIGLRFIAVIKNEI